MYRYVFLDLALTTVQRHLFFTDMEQDIPSEDIVGPFRVRNANGMSSEKLREWLDSAPHNLYVKYHCSALDETDPAKCTKLDGHIPQCAACYGTDKKRLRLQREFVRTRRIGGLKPLRTLDLFSGVGAFSHAMQETGSVKLTHAIEINPSASETLLLVSSWCLMSSRVDLRCHSSKNSPDTVVYNQTANTTLEYAIKRHRGVDRDAPKTISGASSLPDPPRPEDIDCIVAGFPW